ncbi:uncharacterized protein [Leuresthes tenuis]|uniref:uncharacterized protein isoform X2 n=1 Tax=Leuresthes tenuis TaxID=355514 RepID=UPI003B5104D7
MDVSIAVSLIRGQMGTVVERAVNVAVETVLAEMLKVVGVKFEELKAQLVMMKRDMVALQREKTLKEKENDNIRAKLRYTELKLKYYRQGVEEELQQRASTSTLVRIHPPALSRMQRGEAGVSPAEPSCSAQRTAGAALMRNSEVPECTSSKSPSRRAVRVRCPSDVAESDSSALLLPVTLAVNPAADSVDSSACTVLFCPTQRDAAQRKDDNQEDECKWSVTVRAPTVSMDAAVAPPPFQPLGVDAGQHSASVSLSPRVSTQADSSMLPSSALEVKQEVQSRHPEEEVICIKEEPEEEQEVMATLVLDCQVQQGRPAESEGQRSVTERLRPAASQMNPNSAFSSAGPSSSLPSGVVPHQVVRTWPKDLSLYEEYKLRRNELRRRNLNRRRELEKALPQPLLADLVRERREKTRLRVARWRARRKLQACLNQAQTHGGAAGLPKTAFPANSQQQQQQQQQQLRAPCASSSDQRPQQTSAAPRSISFLSNMSANSLSAILPHIPSSSSSLILQGPHKAPHEHTVTSSSSSYPQVSTPQQSISLTDAALLQ